MEMLIEKWFPVDVIGAESMRERGASSALPPLYFLHVWWARRPLLTSRAAILASVLPAWSEEWSESLRAKFPTEEAYHTWFIRACGIFGDPVAGRKLIQWANERNVKLKTPPYSHARAFTVNPDLDTLEQIGDLVHYAWGSRSLSVLDPFAGGGSIPFEATRYRFRTYANELNPVASVILEATLDYPFRFGPELVEDIRKYGRILCDRVQAKLEPFFHAKTGESIHAYIWARTVACPYTGKPIPLVPNWWLRKGSSPVAVKPVFSPTDSVAKFEIIEGPATQASSDPDSGTARRGKGISPWAQDQPVDAHYIKGEAAAGRMGQQLYAVAVKTASGLHFRAPSLGDLEAVAEAERTLATQMHHWEAVGLVPNEPRPGGRSDFIGGYGFPTFASLFLPRQLLAQITIAEELRAVIWSLREALPTERAVAVATYLGIAFDKSCDYNSGQCHWDPTRIKIANTFSLHDFRIRWNPAEFDACHSIMPWVLDQVADAYTGIAGLVTEGSSGRLFRDSCPTTSAFVRQGSATDLSTTPTGSIDHICVDPPYYDNVMYAECSDFFYVWMKRTLGDIYPEFFRDELTNKDDEAVANSSRFREVARSAKHSAEMAGADYERKMGASFREMHRVLKDSGVLTVMFTHKKAEAWDTLATSLIGASFVIKSSWPVHTESDNSLHQAKKNAAKSTILLSCRKRDSEGEPVWWDDIRGSVRRVAREKAEEFEKAGINGVDLYISTFGPVLSILSENWPVLTSEVDERTGEPKPLRPEIALDIAREEVVSLRRKGLLLGRQVQFDPFTDWYLMAWDAFKAEEFPGDEARKLAIALGLDLEGQIIKQKKLVTKKQSTVVIQKPEARRTRGMVDPSQTAFGSIIDAVHTAMMLYKEDGAGACQAFLRQTALMTDSTFKSCLQALINAIPRTKLKGKFVRPEAETLEAMRLAFFDDLEVPQEEDPVAFQLQMDLDFGEGSALDLDGDADEDSEEEGGDDDE